MKTLSFAIATILASGCIYAAATFSPLNPVPQPASVTPSSVVPGGTATLSYSAALATSCSVTQQGCAGAQPVIPSASCVGTGPQSNCSASVTVQVPSTAATCTDVITVSCLPGPTLSSTNLSITATPPPGDCSGLVPLYAPVGNRWNKVLTSRVLWGDGTTGPLLDATNYLNMWTYPGNIPSWPGNAGSTTRPTGAGPYKYFAEKFVVPNDATGRVSWSFVGSGINSNASATISPCSGDFGQTGSQIPQYCAMNKPKSSSGLRTVVAATQQALTCTLHPGATYYLNFLPETNLPLQPTNIVTSGCTAGVCSPWFGLYK